MLEHTICFITCPTAYFVNASHSVTVTPQQSIVGIQYVPAFCDLNTPNALLKMQFLIEIQRNFYQKLHKSMNHTCR